MFIFFLTDKKLSINFKIIIKIKLSKVYFIYLKFKNIFFDRIDVI